MNEGVSRTLYRVCLYYGSMLQEAVAAGTSSKTGAAALRGGGVAPWAAFFPSSQASMDFFSSKKPTMDFFAKKAEGLKSGLSEGSAKLLDTAKESTSKSGGLFGNLTSGITSMMGGQEQNGAVPGGGGAPGATGGATGGAAAGHPHGAAVGPGGMPLPTAQPGQQSGGGMMGPRGNQMGGAGPGGMMGHMQQQPQQPAQTLPSHPAAQQRNQQQQQQQKPRVMKVHRDTEEIFEDSDADSQATEGADDMHHINEQDYEPGMGHGDMMRSGSMGSELSWTSSDDHMLDDMSRDARDFMKNFVYKMFDPDG